MSPAEIEKLKALEREATPGPWVGLQDTEAGYLAGRLAVGETGHVARTDRQGDLRLALDARNALPRMLEERERLLEALRAMLAPAVHEDISYALTRYGNMIGKAHGAVFFAEAPATPAPAGKEEK